MAACAAHPFELAASLSYDFVLISELPHLLALSAVFSHGDSMKLLLAVLVIGTVGVFGQLTQEQIDAMATAPAAYQVVPRADSNTVEYILTTIAAILGILLKLYHGWNKANDINANTMIRVIERNPGVKEQVRLLAAEEGNTSIIHKKVQKVTENGVSPKENCPPADQGTGNTTG